MIKINKQGVKLEQRRNSNYYAFKPLQYFNPEPSKIFSHETNKVLGQKLQNNPLLYEIKFSPYLI